MNQPKPIASMALLPPDILRSAVLRSAAALALAAVLSSCGRKKDPDRIRKAMSANPDPVIALFPVFPAHGPGR